MMQICDFHSHILPGMDDGCQTVEESLEALRRSYAQGVGMLCLTPHYYPVESVSTFLARRQAAMDTLSKAMAEAGGPFPRLCLGAEVAYHPGLSILENLECLCLGSSHYLLLELPFQRWGREMMRDIRNLCNTKGVIPILAHIERYLPLQTKSIMNEMLSQDVLVQMNGEFLLDWKTRLKAKSLLKNGTVQLLGSDCHNLTDRAPTLGEAVALLEKRNHYYLSQILGQSEEIFSQACDLP